MAFYVHKQKHGNIDENRYVYMEIFLGIDV